MEDMYQDGPFSKPWRSSDYVLVVEERKLHVHSSILSMASPVFEAMFSPHYRESITKEVLLEGKRYDVVESMLKLVYPQVEYNLSEKDLEHLQGLTDFSEEYIMDSLRKEVEKQLVKLCKTMVNDRVSLVESNRGYVVQYRTFSTPEDAVELLALADYGKFETAIQMCVQHIGEKYFFEDPDVDNPNDPDTNTIKNLCLKKHLSDKCKQKLIGGIMAKNLRYRNKEHNKDLQNIAEYLRQL